MCCGLFFCGVGVSCGLWAASKAESMSSFRLRRYARSLLAICGRSSAAHLPMAQLFHARSCVVSISNLVPTPQQSTPSVLVQLHQLSVLPCGWNLCCTGTVHSAPTLCWARCWGGPDPGCPPRSAGTPAAAGCRCGGAPPAHCPPSACTGTTCWTHGIDARRTPDAACCLHRACTRFGAISGAGLRDTSCNMCRMFKQTFWLPCPLCPAPAA
jgi:hypothetical protein